MMPNLTAKLPDNKIASSIPMFQNTQEKKAPVNQIGQQTFKFEMVFPVLYIKIHDESTSR